MSAKVISWAMAARPLVKALATTVEVPQLCELIAGYVVGPPLLEPSYYDMDDRHRIVDRRYRVEIRYSMEEELRGLLARDLIEELELTQDCNSNGDSHYRAYFRVRYTCVGLKDFRLPTIFKQKYAYQVVPFGDPTRSWPLTFAGPNLDTMPAAATYRLPNGSVFFLSNQDGRCKFLRRPF
jgi:hypothetical protein